jgi:hypothetical protein
MEPYAVQLLRRFRAGETLEQLVATEGIRRERILIRLEAARRYERAHLHGGGAGPCDSLPEAAA